MLKQYYLKKIGQKSHPLNKGMRLKINIEILLLFSKKNVLIQSESFIFIEK